MPRVYRSMKIAEDGKPQVGRSAAQLGVRVYMTDTDNDVEPDATGNVSPGKGMSVMPAAHHLQTHRIPKRLKHLFNDATGSNSLSIWKMGEGPFVQDAISDDLTLRPDPPHNGVVEHGVIEPSRIMPLEAYEAAGNTRDQWSIDETGA